MANNPDDQNRDETPPTSPIQLHLYTNEHGWTTIDPNVPLAEQPIANSWFRQPNPQVSGEQAGYRAVFVESNIINAGQPQQRGLFLTNQQTSNPMVNGPTAYWPPPQFPTIPTPPPPPGFPPFPQHLVNPWDGGFSSSNSPPPSPLFRFPQPSGQGSDPNNIPVPPTAPLMPPWAGGITVTATARPYSSVRLPPPPDDQTRNVEQNNQRPPDYRNQSNMNILPWVSSTHPTNLGSVSPSVAEKLGHYNSLDKYDFIHHQNSYCDGDGKNFSRNWTDVNVQNSNTPQKYSNYPQERPPRVVAQAFPQNNDPQVVIRKKEGIWYKTDRNHQRFSEKYSKCSKNLHHRSTSSVPTQNPESNTLDVFSSQNSPFETINIRPRSTCPPTTDPVNLVSPPGNSVNYWSFRRRPPYSELPPPPCRCCPCVENSSQLPILQENSRYAIVTLTSGELNPPTLKYSASSELLPDQVARFGSVDLNATHTLEATDQSKHPENTLLMAAKYAPPTTDTNTKRDSVDSILTAFTKAAWKNLDNEMQRLETLIEED